MSDLPTRTLAARLAPIRQALWDNGEITMAGLRRLDRAVGVDTYNQCDGCARGLPVRSGMHYDAQFVTPEMVCTADRYGTQAPSDTD